MLPPAFRLRRAPDFRCAMRAGRRGSRGSVVVHLARLSESDKPVDESVDHGSVNDGSVEVGFVVSRAVGGSVVRHRVVRRLRAIVAARLDELSAVNHGSRTLLVVRARPSAAHATSSELARDLDAALAAASRPAPARTPSGAATQVSGGKSR